jgi:hypothetical protein
MEERGLGDIWRIYPGHDRDAAMRGDLGHISGMVFLILICFQHVLSGYSCKYLGRKAFCEETGG